jgi:hypothetical protein
LIDFVELPLELCGWDLLTQLRVVTSLVELAPKIGQPVKRIPKMY